jgi:hypothetical protein
VAPPIVKLIPVEPYPDLNPENARHGPGEAAIPLDPAVLVSILRVLQLPEMNLDAPAEDGWQENLYLGDEE